MTSPVDLLKDARRQGYALGAFNATNLETAQAVVGAAEAARAPVILQISVNAARYGGLEALFAIGHTLKRKASVPVVLHFDHAERLDDALEALELGFDSVMLESADLSPEDNVQQLQILVEVARKKGAMVEGEFEIVSKEGREGEHLAAEKISELATASGCDLVAIDIGSEHKMTEKAARLDLTRLERIAALVPHPLVLHGSSGVAEGDLQRAVHLGISKVNIATELMQTFTDSVRSSLQDETLYDPRRYLGAAREAMQERAVALLHLLGSAGRAN